MKEGPKTKENLDMTKVICRLCRKQYANKGLWHVCFVDFVPVSLELLKFNLELDNTHSLSLLSLTRISVNLFIAGNTTNRQLQKGTGFKLSL